MQRRLPKGQEFVASASGQNACYHWWASLDLREPKFCARECLSPHQASSNLLEGIYIADHNH